MIGRSGVLSSFPPSSIICCVVKSREILNLFSVCKSGARSRPIKCIDMTCGTLKQYHRLVQRTYRYHVPSVYHGGFRGQRISKEAGKKPQLRILHVKGGEASKRNNGREDRRSVCAR